MRPATAFRRDHAGSLVFDLSITHGRFGSSSHVQQNGLLSHPQDLDAPLHLAAQRKINRYRQQSEHFFSPCHLMHIHRMHGEVLRLLFLQARRETEAHFTATGMPLQHNKSGSFRFKRAAFYQSLKSKSGGITYQPQSQPSTLCHIVAGIVAAPVHAPSPAPLPLPIILSHNVPLPRVH